MDYLLAHFNMYLVHILNKPEDLILLYFIIEIIAHLGSAGFNASYVLTRNTNKYIRKHNA